ncbi:MAG: glycosyltransferase [Chloroflexi bacterium]|nr:glycosyltransferase [Chloroflexota bacterium]
MIPKALLIMAKRPFPGKTKTRLTPPFSAAEAAELYACFLRDTLDLARAVPDVIPFVAYSPPDEETTDDFRKLAPDFNLIPQTGNTLGERLDTVLSHCLYNGYTQVAAMNSDSPTLPAAYLTKAFTHLDDPATDVVLGPCEDGGYYLIGCKRPISRLVCEVQMSTAHVLQDTLTIAQAEKLRVSLLPAWYDVDEVSELHRLRTELQTRPETARHTRCFLHNK